MTSILRTAGSQARNFPLLCSQQLNKKFSQCINCRSKAKSRSMEEADQNEDILLGLRQTQKGYLHLGQVYFRSLNCHKLFEPQSDQRINQEYC
jgi:hypothetical protein